jgi:hypothetical protein
MSICGACDRPGQASRGPRRIKATIDVIRLDAFALKRIMHSKRALDFVELIIKFERPLLLFGRKWRKINEI